MSTLYVHWVVQEQRLVHGFSNVWEENNEIVSAIFLTNQAELVWWLSFQFPKMCGTCARDCLTVYVSATNH